jgi:periplasmic copper chaperone A
MTRFLILAALLLPLSARAADLTVTDAFGRASLGAAPGAGYVTIHGGSTPDRLLSASSPRAKKVALHSMTMQGDVMRMREVEAIDVPANGTVTLAPGGLHMMLEGLSAPLKPGERVPVTLQFEKAGAKQVELAIGPAGARGPAGH